MFVCVAYQFERLGVTLTVEVFLNDAVEHGTRGRHGGEQRRAGSQLHVIRVAKDLHGGTTFNAEGCLGALRQTRPEHWMGQERPRFCNTLHRVSFGGRADT